MTQATHARFCAVTERVYLADKSPAPAVRDTLADVDLDADGAAHFDSGDAVVDHVVFYSGDRDNEAVLGAVAVGKAGVLSVPSDELQHLHIDRTSHKISVEPETAPAPPGGVIVSAAGLAPGVGG